MLKRMKSACFPDLAVHELTRPKEMTSDDESPSAAPVLSFVGERCQ